MICFSSQLYSVISSPFMQRLVSVNSRACEHQSWKINMKIKRIAAESYIAVASGMYLTIDFPNMNRKSLCLTENRDWTSDTKDVPAGPIQSWSGLTSGIDHAAVTQRYVLKPDNPVTIPGEFE